MDNDLKHTVKNTSEKFKGKDIKYSTMAESIIWATQNNRAEFYLPKTEVKAQRPQIEEHLKTAIKGLKRRNPLFSVPDFKFQRNIDCK